MACTGRSLVNEDGDHAPSTSPAQITSTVPITGTSAGRPGIGVASVKATTEPRIAAHPAQATVTRSARVEAARGTRARSPPMPNSHARVGVTKYAEVAWDPRYTRQ